MLVEFFDPACGASRRAHDQLARFQPFVRHTLVVTSLSRKPGSPGEILCRVAQDESFSLATRVSRSDWHVLDHATLLRSSVVCHELIESAALETGRLTNDAPATPVFVFDGEVYSGLRGAAALERVLDQRVSRDAAGGKHVSQ